MAKQETAQSKSEKSPSRSSFRQLGNAALTYAPDKMRQGAENIAMRRVMRSPGFEVRVLSDDEDTRQALDLEYRVWQEKSYGDLEDYKKYLPQSRVLAAYKDGRPVGVTRLFAGAPEEPPFIATMPFYDEQLKKHLSGAGQELRVEEFGTVAVDKELRGGRVFLDLCRLAYRDATGRGIEHWGIIMEPERVEQMNRLMAFTFVQAGPAIDYQGGGCASHVMSFDEVRHNMSTTKPELYDWFVNQPI